MSDTATAANPGNQPLGLPLNDQLGADDEPPRKAGPKPVTTVEELQALDQDAIVRGYRAGLSAAPDYAERDRGYWHGYLNGLVDGKHAQPSPEQALLAHNYVASGALRADVKQWSAADVPGA